MKKKVAVLFGGCSTEYEVSLQSACAVMSHIDQETYEIIPLGITREGAWFWYQGELEAIARDQWQGAYCVPAVLSPERTGGTLLYGEGLQGRLAVDLAFPVLHGKNGEDGTVQGLLELAGIPYVGCDVLSSALCMDKDRAHRLAAAAGVKVPASVVLEDWQWKEMIRRVQEEGTGQEEEKLAVLLREQIGTLSYPVFVKPVKAGSSFGITKVGRESRLTEAVREAFRHDRQVIIEEEIRGFEVGCAVLGRRELTVGLVDEIQLDERESSGFFDYTEKYTLKTSRIHMPARIRPETAERIQETARCLYRALGCRDFARVDMFLTPEEDIVFNEINTIPGCTAHSRYPNMMKGIGIGFAELTDRLLKLGLGEEE